MSRVPYTTETHEQRGFEHVFFSFEAGQDSVEIKKFHHHNSVPPDPSTMHFVTYPGNEDVIPEDGLYIKDFRYERENDYYYVTIGRTQNIDKAKSYDNYAILIRSFPRYVYTKHYNVKYNGAYYDKIKVNGRSMT